MEGVREYSESYDVALLLAESGDGSLPREVVIGWNEGGHNTVEIDLIDLLNWLKAHRPELLEKV
jgi:hypothetical protein